jgi:anti-sigma regulatory factor (Ser/Thr protein kinase)
LDAATAATGFIVDGSIDRAAFEAVVGAPVRRAAAQHRGVRVYGEMVALLWAAGDVGAAMDLERLWNELAASVPFALFCAYPADLVCDPLAGEAFSEVCHLHSTVLAGAPSLPDSEVTRRFPATVHGPRLARRFVNETLAAWRLEAAADDAAVVVSELVANAVVHARSDAVVGITRAPGGIRLAVADRGSELPARADLDTGALRGRGLAMIAAMAQRWGHQVVEGGKVVWAELPAFGASGAA